MVYLASPYTHIQPEMMQVRYKHVMEITAHLIRKSIFVFSPIVHCHNMANTYNFPVEYDFWKRYSESAINSCSSLMIAAIDGWKESLGVRSEYNFAVAEGKTIGMITPLDLGGYELIDELSISPFLYKEI